MRQDTYSVAQDSPSVENTRSQTISTNHKHLPDTMPNILPKIRPVNLKIATLNLDGGLTHVSGRQKVVHSMMVNEIDILALQETRVNSDVVEYHGGYTFHFSTSVSFEQKSAAEKMREKERESANQTLTEIELYNLDAEKQGVSTASSKRLSAYKCDTRQINGRIMMISFDTSLLRMTPYECHCCIRAARR